MKIYYNSICCREFPDELFANCWAVNRRRICFDFSPSAYNRLMELKSLAGKTTKANLVRDALKLYGYWHEKTKEEGYSLVLENEDEQQYIEVEL